MKPDPKYAPAIIAGHVKAIIVKLLVIFTGSILAAMVAYVAGDVLYELNPIINWPLIGATVAFVATIAKAA